MSIRAPLALTAIPVSHKIYRAGLPKQAFYCYNRFGEKSRSRETKMARGQPEKKPRGRPPVAAEKAKRYPLGIRTTKELKDLLQRAADSAGRSVAQEIELRLERSFDSDAALGGPRIAALLRGIAGLMCAAGGGAADEWLDDPPTRRAIFNQVKRHLDLMNVKLSEAEQASLEELVRQVRIYADTSSNDAREIARLQFRVIVWPKYSEKERKKYCKEIQDITGLSSADLENAL
jgi:hypothetical protein